MNVSTFIFLTKHNSDKQILLAYTCWFNLAVEDIQWEAIIYNVSYMRTMNINMQQPCVSNI